MASMGSSLDSDLWKQLGFQHNRYFVGRHFKRFKAEFRTSRYSQMLHTCLVPNRAEGNLPKKLLLWTSNCELLWKMLNDHGTIKNEKNCRSRVCIIPTSTSRNVIYLHLFQKCQSNWQWSEQELVLQVPLRRYWKCHCGNNDRVRKQKCLVRKNWLVVSITWKIVKIVTRMSCPSDLVQYNHEHYSNESHQEQNILHTDGTGLQKYGSIQKMATQLTQIN